jgi:hypothetical protein
MKYLLNTSYVTAPYLFALSQYSIIPADVRLNQTTSNNLSCKHMNYDRL